MQFRVSVDDALEELHAIFAAEGRKPADHFVDEAAKAPPVDIVAVPYFLDDFGGEVLGSAADGGGGLFVLQYLGEAEVGELDVAHLIDDHVFGL